MTQMEIIRKVLQNHGRGVITDSELAVGLFPLLTQENLNDFLIMVSPAVLQVLRKDALAAPRTEEGWRELKLNGGDLKRRYRVGAEALRRHVESSEKR